MEKKDRNYFFEQMLQALNDLYINTLVRVSRLCDWLSEDKGRVWLAVESVERLLRQQFK